MISYFRSNQQTDQRSEKMDTESIAVESLSMGRRFAPPQEFRSKANVRDESLRREAENDSERFWARIARELVHWHQPFQETL